MHMQSIQPAPAQRHGTMLPAPAQLHQPCPVSLPAFFPGVPPPAPPPSLQDIKQENILLKREGPGKGELVAKLADLGIHVVRAWQAWAWAWACTWCVVRGG